MAVGMGWFVQAGVFGESLQASVDTRQLGVMYLGYLVFTIFMTIGAAETTKVLFTVFALINFLFFGLALSSFGIMEHGMHLLAAYAELLIGIVSLYGAGANVLNKHFGFNFLPLGKPFGIFTREAFEKKRSTVKAKA